MARMNRFDLKVYPFVQKNAIRFADAATNFVFIRAILAAT